MATKRRYSRKKCKRSQVRSRKTKRCRNKSKSRKCKRGYKRRRSDKRCVKRKCKRGRTRDRVTKKCRRKRKGGKKKSRRSRKVIAYKKPVRLNKADEEYGGMFEHNNPNFSMRSKKHRS